MKCPGQDTQYWKDDAIFEVKCPECGKDVEFFKDDSARKCEHCGHRFPNPKMDFGCAAYCKYAKQCIGDLAPELVAQRNSLLKDRVAIEMKKYFKRDFKRIGHATRVARYAEAIGKQEGADIAVIMSAAYLHDIGIHEAEKQHGSTAAVHQETEGPPIARSILVNLGAEGPLIEEVCDIVGHHHHPRPEETLNFKVVYDADLIENLSEKQKENAMDEEKLNHLLESAFLTQSGREEARKVLVAN
jgi:HD superfamily phosphodiesterase